MKVYAANYANEKYKNAQEYNSYTALKNGKVDGVFSYSEKDIDCDFYEKNKEILSIKRGNGLWLWKPYFIKKSLEKMKIGEILFYTDSGCYFIKNVNNILNKIDDFNIICFDIPLIEEQFTKKYTLEMMNCLDDKYRKSNQIIGTYFIMKKTKFTEEFVDEWLRLCCNFDLISPSNGENEFNNFISHREDQSIFSLLCKKYDIKPYNDISQLYYFPKIYKEKGYIFTKLVHDTEKLPVILFLHKYNSIKFTKMIKYKIKMILSIFK